MTDGNLRRPVGETALPDTSSGEALRARSGHLTSRLPPPALLCLAGAAMCSAALLLVYQSYLTFHDDEWFFLLERRGFNAGAFLDPNNDHIAVALAAIYKPLLALFGMTSAFPFSVVATLVFLLSALMLFVYVRRRLGMWPALLASVLILFLGAAWTDLLWAFQIGFTGSVAAGIGALLALERDDRRGDLAACALLVLSASFSEVGIPFVVGAFVGVVLGPSPRLRRLYVAFVPLALYGLWYLGWGHTGAHWESTKNLINSPRFVFDSVSASIASLLGLARPVSDPSVVGGLNWGRVLLVLVVAVAGWRLWRGSRPSRWLWAVLATGGSFWFLTAVNAIPHVREATTGRFQYPGAIFVVLIAAEARRGVRADKRVLAAATVITAAAAISGADLLHYGSLQYGFQSKDERARLAAVEIARGVETWHHFIYFSPWLPIYAREYFSAVDAYGSPAFSESELAASDPVHRTTADQELARAERIKLRPAAPAANQGGGAGRCQTFGASQSPGTAPTLRPGEYTLTASRPSGATAEGVPIKARRFADLPSVDLGSLKPGSAASLKIPRDRSNRPWRLDLGGNAVTLCTRGGR